ncbi:MAG TPA: hypothetical protein VFU04_05925 [Solirubrobacterales bacterium]|nr:hypothetical protein [Solirubrobacterales bacterium]
MPDREKRHSRTRGLWALAVVSFAAAALLTASVGLPQAQTATEADLAVSKSDNPDPVVVGAPLTYTVQIVNRGPNPALGVRLTDKLPNTLDNVGVSTTQGTCGVNGRTVSCNIGTIGVGTGATVPTVTITATPTRPGRITNSASVRSRVRDPRSGNDLATESTRVLPLQAATCAGQPATILGTGGDDRLVGTAGDDVVLARGGDDLVHTFRGHDLVCAGRGADVIKTGIWADRVFGNAGRDRLIGGGGADRLRGNRGADRLLGRAGSDDLAGGAGFDVCRGNRGQDATRGCERGSP